MACTNCGTNLCDCTSYTLPTGAQGPAGNQGPTGPAGDSGTTILYNAVVNTASSTTSAESLGSGYTMTNPSPVTTAGDQLIITAKYSITNPIYGKLLDIRMGTVDLYDAIMDTYTPGTYAAIGNTSDVILKITLDRITQTTASGTIWVAQSSNGFPGLMYEVPSASAITIPDLNSGAITIVPRVNDTVAGEITCDRLTVELKEI